MEKLRTISQLHRLMLATVCAGTMVMSSQAVGEDCECDFSPPSVRAYGTNGSCGVFMYEQKTVCEVSFAGAGASPKIAADYGMVALAEESEEISIALVQQHFAYRRAGELGIYLDSVFISQSLPTMVGSVVFRESARSADAAIVEFYQTAVAFSEEKAERIVEIFEGEAEPERDHWRDDITYEIGRGYIKLAKERGVGGQVQVVYFAQ